MTETQIRAVKEMQQAVNASGYKPPLLVDGDPGPKTSAAISAMAARVDGKNIAGRLRALLADL